MATTLAALISYSKRVGSNDIIENVLSFFDFICWVLTQTIKVLPYYRITCFTKVVIGTRQMLTNINGNLISCNNNCNSCLLSMDMFKEQFKMDKNIPMFSN